MKISELIERLKRQQLVHGDLEVTCTGSLLGDGYSTSDVHKDLADIFETSVENLMVVEEDPPHLKTKFGKRLRLYL